MIPVEVKSLDCAQDGRLLRPSSWKAASASARARVVIASGARYRRPAIDDLPRFEGRGVWYWASPIEATLCAGQEVALVGGGNSAGQAAVFLSTHASKVHMLVRGAGPRRDHVALSDRPHRGRAQHRAACRAPSLPRLAGASGSLERVRLRDSATGTRDGARHPQRLPVRRRRSRDRLARGLRRRPRPAGLRAHRRSQPASRRCRPACPASSPSATSAPARSSASAAPSARARRSSPPCTPTCRGTAQSTA